jgi:hypothetical protein
MTISTVIRTSEASGERMKAQIYLFVYIVDHDSSIISDFNSEFQKWGNINLIKQ